ncbi:MAG: hypothetical protein AAGB48_11340, partial [Planctomycetota bacterium]
TRVAKASARLGGRDYVTTDDITDHFLQVAAHRMIVRGIHDAQDHTAAEDAARSLIQAVQLPV